MGQVTFSDVETLVRLMFEARPLIPCLEAADADADGRLTPLDTATLIGALIGSQSPLPPPFPDCGSRLPGVESALGCHEATCRP